MSKVKLDTILTLTLITCAFVTAGILVKREFFTASTRGSTIEQKPAFVKDWHSYLSGGRLLGSSSSPINLIEFADFECPFCASFQGALKDIRTRYPGKVAVTFVEFPLPMHRFAIPAARAAECAAEQGRFEPMHDQLFAQQNQFGLKPWTEIAALAGVENIESFDHCTKRTDPIPRVEQGLALGNKLDIRGTPSVIVNGWRLSRPPKPEELQQIVERILDGKPPVDQS